MKIGDNLKISYSGTPDIGIAKHIILVNGDNGERTKIRIQGWTGNYYYWTVPNTITPGNNYLLCPVRCGTGSDREDRLSRAIQRVEDRFRWFKDDGGSIFLSG